MNDLRRCITEILDETVTAGNPLNYKTCEKAYSICRSLVVVHDAGSELYNGFQQRVGEALGRITSKLLSENKTMEAEDWIGLVVQYCKWFSSRIVCDPPLSTFLQEN